MWGKERGEERREQERRGGSKRGWREREVGAEEERKKGKEERADIYMRDEDKED